MNITIETLELIFISYVLNSLFFDLRAKQWGELT